MKNRFGHNIKKGMAVIAHHPRGGQIAAYVGKVETVRDKDADTRAFVRAYGPRVELSTGISVSIDDCQPLPDTYLHIYECRSGIEHFHAIAGDEILNLETQVDAWLEREYSGEIVREGWEPRMEGDYYAKTMMDGRMPDSPICWEGAGFWTRFVE